MIEVENGLDTSRGLLPPRVIWTPEIELLNEFVAKSVRMQARGCAVFGQQSNGKSSATRYLMSLLPESLGYATAMVRWSINAHDHVGAREDRDFVLSRMFQSGCTSTGHRDTAALWYRFATHLADLAMQSGSGCIVIMVDEAQFLILREFKRIIYCHNLLDEMGIKPFFMFIGQPELANISATWRETNGMHVVARYFMRRHFFRGIAPLDVGTVLECFDEKNVVDVRLSAQLMPQLLGTDWHMGLWGPVFREAIEALMSEHNISEGLRLPMQMLRMTLIDVLEKTIREKSDPRRLSTASVLSSFKSTGFVSSLPFYVCRGEE